MSNQRPVFASLTRISDLERSSFEVQSFPRGSHAELRKLLQTKFGV